MSQIPSILFLFYAGRNQYIHRSDGFAVCKDTTLMYRFLLRRTIYICFEPNRSCAVCAKRKEELVSSVSLGDGYL